MCASNLDLKKINVNFEELEVRLLIFEERIEDHKLNGIRGLRGSIFLKKYI
jgi:hypothetical protein